MAENQEAFQSVSRGISAKFDGAFRYPFLNSESTGLVLRCRLRCVGVADTSMMYAK